MRSITHKERVTILEQAGVESGWYQQQLAIGYEQERGLRAVGQTADAGFQVGVQRTMQVGREDLWNFLIAPQGVNEWLGEAENIRFEPGEEYKITDGTTGKFDGSRPQSDSD